MKYFVGIVLFLWVVYMLGMFVAMRISSWREKHNPKQPWSEDRQPRIGEFTSDHDFGSRTASQKYNEACAEWNAHMAKRVVYELPLEEVLQRDDLSGRYRSEIVRRNRNHIREDYNGILGVDYCPCCHVCGSRNTTTRSKYVSLCNNCYALLESDLREGSGYKLPSGATGFSIELWALQMIVALDLECGVISEEQAQRELRIIVELERRRLKREEQYQQNEAEQKRAAEQRATNLQNAAKRLH